jgi:hypothetical protein
MQKNLDQLRDKIIDTELKRRADNVITEIRALAPVSDGQHSFTDGVPGRTSGGRLRDSFRIGFTTDHGKRVIRIFSSAVNSRGQSYARIVSEGSGPHTIGSQDRNLRFQWIKNGVFVLTPQVHHPGTKRNDFIRQALHIGFHK